MAERMPRPASQGRAHCGPDRDQIDTRSAAVYRSNGNFSTSLRRIAITSMKILVIGGGGREHALVWKLRESPRVEKIWCAPGNGGVAEDATCLPIEAGDIEGLVAIAEKLRPDLTVIGPELPLVHGFSDALRARNLAVVGPSQIAAQLEGSKIFSKHFLMRHSIPTAQLYGEFAAPNQAYAALAEVPYPLVVKADGLCAGKG